MTIRLIGVGIGFIGLLGIGLGYRFVGSHKLALLVLRLPGYFP